VAALEQVGDAARELHHLEPAGDLAHRVGVHLAVLGGDDRGELVLAGVEQLAEGEEHLRTTCERRRAPARGGARRGGESATRPVTRPVAGLVTSAQPAGEPVRGEPSTQCTISTGTSCEVEVVMRLILLVVRHRDGCRIVGIARGGRTLRHPVRA
jgi:hypothetical protein